MSINNLILTGNLGDDPAIHYAASSGEPVANFDLAYYCGKGKDGTKRTGWIRCVAFRKTAELAEQHLHKGARITVVGSLDENSWTDDNNNKRKNHQIILHGIEFIKTDGRGFGEAGNAQF